MFRNWIFQTFSRYVLADCDLDPILIALQLEIELEDNLCGYQGNL